MYSRAASRLEGRLRSELLDHARGVAKGEASLWNVGHDHGAGPNRRSGPDADSRKDQYSVADPDTVRDQDRAGLRHPVASRQLVKVIVENRDMGSKQAVGANTDFLDGRDDGSRPDAGVPPCPDRG